MTTIFSPLSAVYVGSIAFSIVYLVLYKLMPDYQSSITMLAVGVVLGGVALIMTVAIVVQPQVAAQHFVLRFTR